jgi:hypothetical protein
MAKATTKNNKPSAHQLKHNSIAKNHLFFHLTGTRYKVAKHNKTTGTRSTDGITMVDKSQLQYSLSGIAIHPEFLPYFFEVPDGCAKKLLLYIIFHVVDTQTCQFPFNEHVCQQFIDYCKAINPETIYKMDSVKIKAIRELVKSNLVISLRRKQYMLNPIILSNNKTTKWLLINTYIQELIKKKKAVDANFFPKYGGK